MQSLSGATTGPGRGILGRLKERGSPPPHPPPPPQRDLLTTLELGFVKNRRDALCRKLKNGWHRKNHVDLGAGKGETDDIKEVGISGNSQAK